MWGLTTGIPKEPTFRDNRKMIVCGCHVKNYTNNVRIGLYLERFSNKMLILKAKNRDAKTSN
jgi:hypothetical protein